ncbi:MAG: formate dehydrogenase accessory sulfurtransferase FdhD [Myxococcota bacterium]|nr:formate dehydrogenase accessory sulfurtransferase FdhD [Myxococcota bacterium]
MRAPRTPEDAPLAEGARSVARTRVDGAGAREAADRVAHEEPLEIQVGGTPLVVLMRTPGHDEELATGFLVTERVVARPGDLASVRHCDEAPTPEAADNVVRIRLRPGLRVDLEALRRNLFASAACGVCGTATLENVLATAPPLEDPARFPAALLRSLPGRLREAQRVFDATGGLHAAGLFDARGRLVVAREDVGRHNAVDKVVGFAVREGRFPLAGHLLMVSGRVSYEIVRKALAARCPLVAAVSAPSSLAVSLAEAGGVGLVGFLRGEAFNVYGARERVLG